jgi:hypothetical protein
MLPVTCQKLCELSSLSAPVLLEKIAKSVDADGSRLRFQQE